MTKLTHTLLFTAVSLAAASVGFLAYRAMAPAPAYQASPTAEIADFSLPDLNGQQQTLDSWKGSWRLVNFWATWCPPCVEEMPLLNELQSEYDAHNLQIIGIALDDEPAVKQFAERLNINFPLLLAEQSGSALTRQWGNRDGALPFSALVTPSGDVAERWLGQLKPEEIRNTLNQYLKP